MRSVPLEEAPRAGRLRIPRRVRNALVAFALLVSLPPGALLSCVWWHVLRSPLPGGRHGPLDAYRHTLASAYVAFVVSPRAVAWVTVVMESCAKASCRMDRHNNTIGAALGSRAARWSDIEPAVAESVATGRVNAREPWITTWLPPGQWKEGKLW